MSEPEIIIRIDGSSVLITQKPKGIILTIIDSRIEGEAHIRYDADHGIGIVAAFVNPTFKQG